MPATPTRKTAASRRRGSPPRRGKKIDNPEAAGTHGRDRPVVVGIGASAGGLEALKVFFGAMPPKTGLVFVVVVHLDPTHESLMPQLLAHVTDLTVEQARDRQPLETDHVYIIPPNRTLTLEHGLIRLREVVDRRSLRGTIDRFFRSLAEAERDRAAAIVLSGTGTEGTLGTRAIKAEGGLVLAQAPATASQPGMPSSAIATGLVDVVLPPAEMPQALLAYMRTLPERQPSPAAGAEPLDGLPAILAFLHGRTNHDFRVYKTATLQRRIERRMGLQQINSLSGYLDHLRAHPAEVDELFKDLLIGVTSFFRDPAAFDELGRTVLAALIRERDDEAPIRIWVPGCSTGEEAYSLAIVLAERIEAAQSACRVQIFATDVDEDALELARAGTYPDSIALDVTPERLQRFFTRDDHRYTIAKSIRQSVAFAVQNLTTDPPFSRLDLVSCRNVLIYLEPEIQKRLMSLFHFALKPGGYLFLGGAEGVGLPEGLFTPLSKPARIFQRRGLSTRSGPAFSRHAFAPTDASRLGMKRVSEPTLATVADQLLLAHLAPAAVIVRSSGQIVRFYGPTERYMALPRGEATLDVFTLARDALKPTLRAALHGAIRRNRPTVVDTLGLGRGEVGTSVRVSVKPLDGRQTSERLWLILFEESHPSTATSRKAGRGPNPLVRRLEAELRTTQREQQHLVEQLESTNQELMTAHEEVLSMNEELQATNQELTTSKEELQAMNEELTTLNAQLQDKVRELTSVNDDLANLLASSDIATVFLDTDLQIKRFTTTASQVFHLQESDVGRPLSHLTSTLARVDLSRCARQVLDTGTADENEVSAQDGREYFLRVLPYRAEGDIVQGVVLTLVEVTALKRVERDLQAAKAQAIEALRRMTRLHELSVQLANTNEGSNTLEYVVRTAVDVTGAAMGIIRRANQKGVLSIVAHVGFDRPFLDFFDRVDVNAPGGCCAAVTARERVVVDDVATSALFAGSPSLAVLTAAGVRSLQATPLFDRAGCLIGMFSTHYRELHHFDNVELRWLDLLARHAADVIERQHLNEIVQQSHDELERRVTERTRWLSLLQDVASDINGAATWDDALHRVLRRLCETEHWQIGFVYLPLPDDADTIAPVISCYAEDRFRSFHDVSMQQTYARGGRLPGRVYAENAPFWAIDTEALMAAIPARSAAAADAGLRAGVAFPVPIQAEIVAVLEIFSDQEHPPSGQLTTLMLHVSDHIGRVLERERATARMADLVWREQQELLHALHDSLGQTLTGLGMLSTGLRQRLAPDSETANTAAEIARQAQRALDDVRQLAKKLFPLEVDAQGLTTALRDLASATAALHKITVRVQGELPAARHGGKVATELYRIAQEAVTNGVRHGRAQTITIRLDGARERTRLTIADDGVGIPDPAPGDGAGLRIMRYRATSIGAVLSVERAATGGTIVTCTLRQAPSAKERYA